MTGRKEETTISTKGQVVLPVAVRNAAGWKQGDKLIAEYRNGEVVLRSATSFKPTRLEDVFGSANYHGPEVPIENMDPAIDEMFRERHARGRY